ncbi:hypothetical protein RWV98_02295 [Agathobaculum sp. NTUH-O15-33]|uniref:hypothetical protein n=1 Tax=Agathobaculum sp. NTUH-O15-33 TaxID=3079302 RepID=UPI002958913F|nr:hypothetical protein [Agathobaculum sp. NTUH-O15-33]WNX85128.1 hypothetical protein RWV98_02295 [Agathobaculum sp. NTUH-O15-33]
MLRKLIGYEWKACARACLPVYGALLVVALINRVFSALDMGRFLGGMPEVLAAMAYFGVMVAVFVVTTVILIQRFYKSLLGDEGYLMFTLPVTVTQHIWAKSIIALVMSFLSCIASVLSVVILSANSRLPRDIAQFISEIFHMFARSEYGAANSVFYMIEAILLVVLFSLAGLLFIYLCIALGHLAKKHRVAMAIVWYFVLTTVMQFLFSMIFFTTGGQNVFEAMFRWVNHIPEAVAIHVGLLVLCLGAAIPGAIFFLGTRYVLKNKLNLE